MRSRFTGDLLLHPAASDIESPSHTMSTAVHEGQIVARLVVWCTISAASSTCRSGSRCTAQMQLGVAIFETKTGAFHALRRRHFA